MRVIGHSTLANGSPYSHLAYLAATTIVPEPSLWSASLWLYVGAGITLAGTGLLRRWLSWRRLALAAGVGGLLLSTALVASSEAKKRGTRVYVHPEGATRSRAIQIFIAIYERRSHNGEIPEDTAGIKGLGLETGDGWFRDVTFSKEPRPGEPLYVVTSAGPDGLMGTTDNRRYTSDDFGYQYYTPAADTSPATAPVPTTKP